MSDLVYIRVIECVLQVNYDENACVVIYVEMWFAQIQAYEEDFSNERRDRERAQGEKDNLQQQLLDAQDLIATLTQEVRKILSASLVAQLY